MARKPRLHVPGGLYHVILRGNAGDQVFFDDEDCFAFYALLEDGCDRFGYRIHAFCLMPNHVHLALQVGDKPLSRGMQNLVSRYTRHLNRVRGRIGHVFHGRYKALLVDSDSYLLELVRYIHLNPVRARLVHAPGDYPFSGHAGYMGQRAFPFLTTDWVLSQLDARVATARRRYGRFLAEGVGEGHREDFHRGPGESRVLGPDGFVERSLAAAGEPSVRTPKLDAVIGAVCQLLGVDRSDLARVGRGRSAAKARSIIGWLAMATGAGTLTELAKLFGRDVSTLSRQVRSIEQTALDSGREGRVLRKLKNTIMQA